MFIDQSALFSVIEFSNSACIESCKCLLNFTERTELFCENTKDNYLICEDTFSNFKNLTTSMNGNHHDDLETILKSVSFKLFSNFCANKDDNTKKSINYSLHNNFCHNSSCFEEVQMKTWTFMPCVNLTENNSPDLFIQTSSPFLIFGLISLFGNSIVIFQKLFLLVKKANLSKEMRIYYVLVLNLALSDFLMAIYLTAIGNEVKIKFKNNLFFSEINLCNVLGIINFVSSEVSLTTLLIISFFRLHSIVFPYRQQHLRLALLLTTATWVFWITIATLPLLNIEPLARDFTVGIRFNHSYSDNADKFFFFFDEIQFLKKLSIEEKHLKNIINAVLQNPSRNVLISALETFGFLRKNQKFHYMGFYSFQFLCSINFLISDILEKNRLYYLLSTIFYNVICTLLIIIAYFVIFLSLFNVSNTQTTWKTKLKNILHLQRSHNHYRNKENRRMFRQISVIVGTDVIAWVPVCLVPLLVWQQQSNVSDCNGNHLQAYRLIQLVLCCAIVANSIINPYIYSIRLWKRIYYSVKKKISQSLVTSLTSTVTT